MGISEWKKVHKTVERSISLGAPIIVVSAELSKVSDEPRKWLLGFFFLEWYQEKVNCQKALSMTVW